jgi:serine/threonine protein kinase
MAAPLRFGEKAIEMKVLTVEQVEEGLQLQEQSRARGLDRSLGACLHDRHYIDLVQVEAIMKALGYPPDKCRLVPDVELLELLGRGASGAVYRAYSHSLGEDVAVKVRAPKACGDDPEGNRFRAEARIGQRLAHPNIVRLFDAGETHDFTYHILEYVRGRPLDQLIKTQGRLPEDQVIDMGIQLASALDCAAKEGIIHRDVKPANVLVADTGRVKLCDLGLAKDTRRGTMLTADGVLLGSPFYIAPEYANTGAIDARSDIYSLGVTLFHAATGTVPFPGRSAIEILQRVVQDEAPEPRSIAPELSPGLSATIAKMMAKDPAARFQTAAEVLEAFRGLRAGRAPAITPARKPSLFGRILGLFARQKAQA